MAYTKTTNFAIKDTLLSGDVSKRLRGAEIDAEFNAIAAASVTTDNFLQDGVGAVSYPLKDKLKQTVSLKDFGAIGDGVTDDTAALKAAFASGGNRVIDGGGLTYIFNDLSYISSDNVTLQNMTLDCSGFPGSLPHGTHVRFSGTLDTPITLTANTVADSRILSVGSTATLAANDYLYLSSDALYSEETQVVLGKLVQIKSIVDPTKVELIDNVEYDFNASDNAKLVKLNLLRGAKVYNVHYIGSGLENSSFMVFRWCESPVASDCLSLGGGRYHISIDRCVGARVSNCTAKYGTAAIQPAYAYGVTNACLDTIIERCSGEGVVRLVYVGANGGINIATKILNNYIKLPDYLNGDTFEGIGAAIQVSDNSNFTLIQGNHIASPLTTTGFEIGITLKSKIGSIIGNTITGYGGHNILIQPSANVGTSAITIADNTIVNSGDWIGGNSACIWISASLTGVGAELTSIQITGNNISTTQEYGIFIHAHENDVSNVNISNNIISGTTGSGVQMTCVAGVLISNVHITNNILTGGLQSANGIHILAPDAANKISNVSILNNTLKDHVIGIRLVNVDNVKEIASNMVNCASLYFLDANSTAISTYTAYSGVKTVVADYLVWYRDEFIVCNPAANITLTLPSAAQFSSRELKIKNISSFLVASNVANVVPTNSATPGVNILPATPGASVILKSDGVNWIAFN